MKSKESLGSILAGTGAGAVNGLFGAGGGMVLVPLLTGVCGLPQRRAFATSVAVILPLCALSVVIYLLRGGLDEILTLVLSQQGIPVVHHGGDLLMHSGVIRVDADRNFKYHYK